MNRQDQFGQFGQSEEGSVHETAGAYVLGILDDAEATAFEAHLAGCDICAAHLEEFAGMEPMLAMLAEAPARPAVPEQPTALPFDSRVMQPPARSATVVPTAPSPQLLNRLVDEVAVKRSRKRRRSMYMIAASAVLILGGPAVAVVVTQDDATAGSAAAAHPTSAAEDVFFDGMGEKIEATDAATRVSATVGLEEKGWGTHAVLELKNVKGPLKCSLVAVSKSGEEEVVSSWSVPERGYGIADSTDKEARKPLYIHGGAAMERNEIDHFEVRTFDGKRLVEVGA
ncbi:RNA polymerase subunit sigma [Streptomyces spongiicola]|uniref:RNA polymerase subunit sigma n=1 Tax=Streptomyces spongiicola TaxID=1690221 RepID=A0A2S1YY34_9ACTN|nr:zf-HC2 domain-containing protein [Streptomyces spongiicola]AWK08922.1 RNA polymerase subunit sigma [Streptomyces spongiicola]GBP99734.1 RNA polymerase subunit sigma [Streptomyces spongiicola]